MSKIKEHYHDLIEKGLKECTECDGKGYDEYVSDCCGEKRDPDTTLCFFCKEFSDPTNCNECNGTGTLPYTDKDIENNKENEIIGNKLMMEDN